MKLSILIPSIPSRVTSMNDLFTVLQKQVDALPEPGEVEILTLIDNKRRSIGMKRQALLDIANGDYIAFIDDDDWVSGDYIHLLWESCRTDVDVITFKQRVYVNNTGPFPLTFKLGHPENESPAITGFTRPPWHVCAWHKRIAKKAKYTDKMYGEDWDWAMYANMIATTSHHIDLFICEYHYKDTVTEAK